MPKLKVTNRQEITYRLLVFGEMVVYDEIDGTSGRPLSGVLGALFKVIGDGRLYHSVLVDDGLQAAGAGSGDRVSPVPVLVNPFLGIDVRR